MQNQECEVSSFNEGLGDIIPPILIRIVTLNRCEIYDIFPMNLEGLRLICTKVMSTINGHSLNP